MIQPRRAALDGSQPSVPEHVEEQVEEAVALDEELHFEAEAFTGRRLLGPLALAAGLAAAVAGAVLLPQADTEDVADTATTVITSTHREDPVSRASTRPVLTSASPSTSATPRATPTPKPTASATPRPKARPSATSLATPKALKADPSRAAASPRPKASREARVPALAEVVGTRYATTVINVRTAPSSTAERIGGLVDGESVRVTSLRQDGWRQVSLDGRAGWVKSDYLTRERPQSSKDNGSSPRKDGSPSSNPTSTPTKSTPRGGACSSTRVEAGLVSNAIAVHQGVCRNFPSITNFGGVRGSADAHGTGHALDIMVSGERGWEVARWARANASSLGVTEVIYAQQIWTTQRAGEGWRSMSDRGSATANHFDHVHVTVR